MSKTRVRKPLTKPLVETPVAESPRATLNAPTAQEPASPPTEATRPKREGPKIRYCRVTSMLSVTMYLPHEDFCEKAGKCFCEQTDDGRRVGRTWHLIAGVPQVVPMVWTTHPLMQSMLRAGKVLVKLLV